MDTKQMALSLSDRSKEVKEEVDDLMNQASDKLETLKLEYEELELDCLWVEELIEKVEEIRGDLN